MEPYIVTNRKKLIISITGLMLLSALTVGAIYFSKGYDFSSYKSPEVDTLQNETLPDGFDLSHGVSTVNNQLKDRFNRLPEYDDYREKVSHCFEDKYLDMYIRHKEDHDSNEIIDKTELICLGAIMSSISFDEYLDVRKKLIIKFTVSTIKEGENYRYMTGFYEELNRDMVIYAGEANLIDSVEIINKTLGINVVISDDVMDILDYTDINEKIITLGHSGRFIDIINQIAGEFQLVARIDDRSVVFDLPKK